jgi:DNA-binding NtrC family response regulator
MPEPRSLGEPPARILLVDDSLQFVRDLRQKLKALHPSWELISADSPERAMNLLSRHRIDAMVSEAVFRKDTSLRFIAWAARHDPELPCVIVTGRPDLAPRRALPMTVTRVLVKPPEPQVVAGCVERVLRLRAPTSGPEVVSAVARPPASAIACSASLSAVARALRSAS